MLYRSEEVKVLGAVGHSGVTIGARVQIGRGGEDGVGVGAIATLGIVAGMTMVGGSVRTNAAP